MSICRVGCLVHGDSLRLTALTWMLVKGSWRGSVWTPAALPGECVCNTRVLQWGCRPVMGMGWLMWTGWQREGHSGSRRKLWKLCGGRRGSELGWDFCGIQTALENKDTRIQYKLYCLLLLTIKTFWGMNLNLFLHMLLDNSTLFKVLFHKGIHKCCCGMAHRLKIPR